MNIFTTINPYGNFKIQDKALRSWSKFNIYSINTLDEINLIKDKFSYVNFIETNQIYKNKYIKLNGILLAIKNMNSVYSCIINSDIILNGELKIDESLLDDGIIISTRYELDDEKDPYPFVVGYDIFMFKIDKINILLNDNYVIGMPWWDYWIPIISYKYGLKIYHIKNKIFYHKTHSTNYDSESWVKFGEHLYKDIIVDLMGKKIDIDIYNFCTITKRFIEQKQIDIEI